MIDRFVRRHFLEFKPYQSARSEAHRAEIFLDANELSFGSPVSLDGVSLNRYPDPVQRKLRESIASRIGVPVEMIFAGVGSDEIIDLLIRLTCSPQSDTIGVLEPTYGVYQVAAHVNDVEVRTIPLDEDFQLSLKRVEADLLPSMKIVFCCSPNNPTGKVFTKAELEFIRDLCVRWNAYCITDEIYEHILYDGAEHVSMARIEGMRDRTIVINGLSKTYSVTGWRVGWVLAPPGPTQPIRKVHDFLTVGAAAPLQQAGASALHFPQSYYDKLAHSYSAKRERLLKILTSAGFTVFKPRGAYYIMTDISRFADPDPARFPAGTKDVRFAKYLVEKIGVAVVPGSSFYNDARDGASQVRFTFCKKEETLAAAEERLSKLHA